MEMNASFKQLSSTLFFLLWTLVGFSQVEYLRLSPSQKIIQRIGATDVTLEFSRPQMKGRKIFGQLVPYEKLWRTGANENTTISFSHRVRIGTTKVAKGTYALMTKPRREQWDIYLYTETNHLDIPDPIDSVKLIYLTTVAVQPLAEPEETLVINLYDITEQSCQLGIQWEKTRVNVPITFYTREAMELAMEREMKQNILDFAIAASYYHQRDIELATAKKFQELAMELRGQPNAWDHHSYGIILYKMGESAKGLEHLRMSLEMAQASENDYLIRENKRLMAEWAQKD
ncbi:MAG: DUF2911 domain-containing protein [Bacteroidota bacterium]